MSFFLFSLLLVLLLLSEFLRLIINFNHSLSTHKSIFISLIIKTWVCRIRELIICNKLSIILILYYSNSDSITVLYKAYLIEVNKLKVMRLIWTYLSTKIYIAIIVNKDSNYKINNL